MHQKYFQVVSGFRAAALGLLMLIGGVAPGFSMGPASVSEMAAALSGAVVNISTSRQVSGGRGDPYPELPPGSPLRELFDGVNPNVGQGEERLREARSLGSGFLISEAGLIVTNNHVIAGADEILIYTSQGERYVAEIIGVDEKTDMALLKISSDQPFGYVEFGDSDSAEVGDWVMAIGNPFGLGGSVSLGIVSARNRNINSGPYDDFIQTDAAINLGNSGGPLFDMNGDVVGIVTAIIVSGGSSRGIGFAVPTNLAQPVLDQLIAFGETRRGWLGVGIQDVSEELAAQQGLHEASGALIVEVTPGGPSEGILVSGDIVTKFGLFPIVKVHDLPRHVAQTQIGEPVVVQIIRDGELVELIVTLGRLEDGERLIAAAEAQEQFLESTPQLANEGQLLSDHIRNLLGFSLLPLTPHIRESIGRGSGVSGLLISDVLLHSQAFENGLRSGLVLSHIDESEVTTIAEIETLINGAIEAKRPSILLRATDSSGITFNVTLPLD